MTYVEGFVSAVPTASKDAYIAHIEEAAPLLASLGVHRMVEAWGDDVQEGKATDFRGSVKAEAAETVVFSWFEYPSRAARDASSEKMMKDEGMMAMVADMPFDGKRTIIGGFEAIVDVGHGGPMGYIDGFIVPVPAGNRDLYRRLASEMADLFLEYGARRVVEAWGDDVPEGKITDFRRAVKAEDGEAVVFSWIEWPSKDARVKGWEKVMADERAQPDHASLPFDGQRIIYGGFAPLLDAKERAPA